MDRALFFDSYFREAEVNFIMFMNGNGTVLDIDHAFTNNFAYQKEVLERKNFDVLSIQRDKEKNKPELELETVLSKEQVHDMVL